MLKSVLLIFTILINTAAVLQKTGPNDQGHMDYYRSLNDKETRLIEFKDDDKALQLKVAQLDIINKSRKKFRVKPVQLDILASRVANKMCMEAAENKYISHWDMAGEKPYHRYAFAGGYDHISENAFGEWTTGWYDNSSTTVLKMMKDGHESFMAERAPANGHKKNVIDISHNYVGIGFYLTKNQFRYYEEFINRYLEFENIPASLNVNEAGSISFKTDGSCFPYFITIYREDFPLPLKPEQLNKKGSYSDFSNQQYLNIPAWDIARQKNGNSYTIPLMFTKEGLYYIQVFIDKREITTPVKLSTKGRTIASGIVIKVVK
jgi:uncharacterized protein YkwD